MNSDNLLSIIIPTYNGGLYLEENLSELISQYNSLTRKDVEIIISNNASNDNTDEVVCKSIEKCPSIKYIRRETNIGSMSNFTESVKESSGKFVFLLGDDDIICPRFIEIITTLLDNNSSVSLLHWNRIDYKMRDMKCSLFNPNIEVPFFCYYDDFSGFLKKHATMDSMSTVLFSRESWLKGEQYVSEHHYGYLWYSRILNGSVGSPCIYSFYPLVVQRHPSQRKWAMKQPLYTCGLMNIYRDINDRVPGVYEWIKDHYVMLSKENFLNEMLIVANNKNWYKPYYEELIVHYNKQQKNFAHAVLFVFPSFLSKVIISIVKVFVFLNRRLRR